MNIQAKYADASNYQKGRMGTVKYIVLHYTANDGDTAKGNCSYFQGKNRGASAHYFVDETSVWQSVRDEDTAWHCGTKGTYYHPECRNANSIGVELCSRERNGIYYFKGETVHCAAELVRELTKRYGIDTAHVIRHYDVTHKLCPAPWVRDSAAWEDFKEQLKGEETMTEAEKREFEALKTRVQELEEAHRVYNMIGTGEMPAWIEQLAIWARDNGIIEGTGAGWGMTQTKAETIAVLKKLWEKLG